MASELIRPTVVTFLDQMLRDREKNLRVDEVAVSSQSPWAGRALGSVDLRAVSNALLLACRLDGQRWVYNPPNDLELRPGTVLILMGSPEDIEAVRRAAGVDAVPVPTSGVRG
ncbi:MAG: TrkA C-terminal domain-containing protein [Gemmatimonadetes bacterium]|nr:TrkA C-terminal domain-containing protein [Gemmatimonadota bacterium]